MQQRFSTPGCFWSGILRRTGPKGVSLRATGAWELSGLWEAFGAEVRLEAKIPHTQAIRGR